MERVIVVGPSGSGKTTSPARSARRAAASRTPSSTRCGGTRAGPRSGPSEFRRRLAPVVAGDRWVLCGNYFSWARATSRGRAPTRSCGSTSRVADHRPHRRDARSGARVAGVELWSGGNREQLRDVLGRDELLRFAWREYPKYRRALLGDPRGSGARAPDGDPARHRRVSVRAWLEEVAAVPAHRLIVITGPPGAGKSTVAAALAAQFDPSVLVARRRVLRLPRHRRVEPWLPESQRARTRSSSEAIGRGDGRVRGGGYTTIFDGIVGPWFLPTFAAGAGVPTLHYVLLLPSVERCLERVATRVDHDFDDPAATRKMHGEFAGAEIDPRHVVADPPDGVDAVADLVAAGLDAGRFACG